MMCVAGSWGSWTGPQILICSPWPRGEGSGLWSDLFLVCRKLPFAMYLHVLSSMREWKEAEASCIPSFSYRDTIGPIGFALISVTSLCPGWVLIILLPYTSISELGLQLVNLCRGVPLGLCFGREAGWQVRSFSLPVR